jgi:protein O-mannosyl-transferase
MWLTPSRMSNLPQKISGSPWFAVVFIVLFVLGAYSPILNSSFKVVYDSEAIVGNPQVRNLDELSRVFTHSFFKSNFAYRPLTVTSHALEYQFFSLTPFFYYSSNILIHIFNALLVYALVVLLIRERPVAFLAALLFSIHPAHWEAVSFLSGRPELLNALFNLLALVCCVLYMHRLQGRWIGLSVAFFICALLACESREFYCLVFFSYFLFLSATEEAKGLRWLVFLPYAVVTFLYMGLRQSYSGVALPAGESADFILRLLAASRALIVEINGLLMPGDLHPRYTVSAVQAPDLFTWISAGLSIGLAGFLWTMRKNLNGTVSFLLAWFLIGLWPAVQAALKGSSDFPGQRTFVYMPVIALMTLAVLMLGRLFEASRKINVMARPIVTLAGVGFITLFFLLTYKNTARAYDEVAILEETGQLTPSSSSVQHALGLLYAHKGNIPQAQYHFSRAVELDPGSVQARMGLAKAYYMQGQYVEAVRMYESIQNPGRYKSTVDNNLKMAYSILTLNQEAVLQKNPQDISAYFSLGIFYTKLGEATKAIDSYQRVIELDAQNQSGLKTLALKFQGILLHETGQPARAQDNFNQARL